MSETVLEIAAPECVAEDFDGEIVAINLKSGVYFSAKDAGAVLWRDLTTGHSVESLMDLATGNQELARSIARFAEDALSGGLMRKAQAVAAPARAPNLTAQTAGAALPFLESYSDMKSLLLLDPIHEVDEESGWPVRPPREESSPSIDKAEGGQRQEPKE